MVLAKHPQLATEKTGRPKAGSRHLPRQAPALVGGAAPGVVNGMKQLTGSINYCFLLLLRKLVDHCGKTLKVDYGITSYPIHTTRL